MNILNNFKKIAENQGITITALESKLGASKGVLSRAIANNTDIQAKWLLKLVDNYPQYNPTWLLTGEGDMIKKEGNPSLINNPIEYYKSSIKQQRIIPLIPISAMAGYGNGETEINEADITDGYVIPDFDEKGVKYLIRVNGSSMYPKYSNGDLLGCKPIKDLTFFQWGKCYVLDTDQGPIVKRLFEVDGEPDLLLCKSENEERYPPFKIHRKSIYRTAIIVGVLRLE